MSDGLIRSSADWAAMFRARITELGLSHLDVDHIAGLPDGYCNKILNGKKKPGAVTIERMCAALKLALRPVVEFEPVEANSALECVAAYRHPGDVVVNDGDDDGKTTHQHTP